ncbi:MAG: hypothetical protein ACRDZX_02100 [Acidimicrobiales bacterium]
MAEANRDTTLLDTEAESARRRKLADAEGDAQRVSAQAADAEKAKAEAQAYSQRATAQADADAINARAEALSGENQALIAVNKLVDMLPALVQAAAAGISGSSLTVLNGSRGSATWPSGSPPRACRCSRRCEGASVTGAGEHSEGPAMGIGKPDGGQ